MRTRFPARMAMAVMLGLSVVACGGGGSGDDPTAPVKGVISAIESKDFDKIADYACAAKKDEIKQQFNFEESMAGQFEGLPGVKGEDIVDALSFKFEGIKVTEESRSGDKAQVKIEGTMKMSADSDKIKKILEAAGGEAAGMVDMVVSGIEAMSGEGVDMDSTMEVVKENGTWLLCEALN